MGTVGSINPTVQTYASAAAASYSIIRQSTPGGGGSLFIGGSSRSTPSTGSYSAIQSGDGMLSFVGVGDTGSNLNAQGAGMSFLADGNWSTTSAPGKITFSTTISGATNYTTAATFDSKQHLGFSQSATTTATSCGTSPSLRSGSTDVSGEITMGTGSPTSCQIIFGSTYTAAPNCIVAWKTNLASMIYTEAVTGISLTQTATSSNKVGWHCFGL